VAEKPAPWRSALWGEAIGKDPIAEGIPPNPIKGDRNVP